MNHARPLLCTIESRIVGHRWRRSRTQSTRSLSRGSLEDSRGLTGEPDLIEFRIRAPRRFVIPASNLDASLAPLSFDCSLRVSYRVFHLRPVDCQDTSVHHIDAVAAFRNFIKATYSRVLSMHAVRGWTRRANCTYLKQAKMEYS